MIFNKLFNLNLKYQTSTIYLLVCIRPTSAVLGKAENTEIYRNQMYYSNVSSYLSNHVHIYTHTYVYNICTVNTIHT